MAFHHSAFWRTASALVAVFVGSALGGVTHGAAAGPTDGTAEWHLPTAINAPGAWSTDEYRSGPIAALGLATRFIPEGLLDKREQLSTFATSAVDGSSAWLDLPGYSLEHAGLVGGVAVSPDGRWLGWVRASKGQAIKGWSIQDTTTGDVRHLDVEGHSRVRPAMSELAFSGDSRYLLTSYETPDSPKRGLRNHEFVAWNVTDGAPTILEDPGFYWLPNLGHAEDGVVWSRNLEVFRADPESGRSSVTTLPRTVLMASWAPDDAAFAYIGRDDHKKGQPEGDERLYVGETAQSAQRVVDLPDTSPIGEALAWRDETHVVVGNYRHDMYVVDITDGSYDTLDLAGSGEQVNTPQFATALWAKPLRPPVAPTGTTDPRRPWLWAGSFILVALLGVGALLLRRAD